MKKIDAWETEDEVTYTDYQDALRHERRRCMKAWYEDNPIIGGTYGCTIDWTDFNNWLLENQEELKKLLDARKPSRGGK